MTYLMPRYKFKQLWSAFRMYDCTKSRSFKKGKYSKIYKVQYFYEQVWARMKATWDNGTMNAMDELGIPSRHKWLRHFNPNKPHKYHMELLGIADSKYCRPYVLMLMEGSWRYVDEQGEPCAKMEYRTPQIPAVSWEELDEGHYGKVMDMLVDTMLRECADGSIVITDSRFSSLVEMLKAEKEFGVKMLGTFQVNRKFLPLYNLLMTKDQKNDRGYYHGCVLRA